MQPRDESLSPLSPAEAKICPRIRFIARSRGDWLRKILQALKKNIRLAENCQRRAVESNREVFVCQRCGHCCEGKGGIVLSDKDLSRLAAFFESTIESVIAEFAELSNGKLKIRSGADGYCVFFRAGIGCGAHPARPDICRAWPFFRGNLVDPTSLAFAKDYCPGILREASFEEFGRAGLAYIEKNDLAARGDKKAANSLAVDKLTVTGNWNR